MNSKLWTITLCAVLAAPGAWAATDERAPAAQDASPAAAQSTPSGSQQQVAQPATKAPQKATRLQGVTVTGSLIPRTEIETATPIVTITGQDMRVRGFATVAQALQSTSMASGSVQGSQFTGGFTPGAETLSFFGMPPGFVKYLINGKPMGDFPALYNGSDAFNNIAGIPVAMVDHIDILPGGQSSLYGSDAIGGVINIVLKKNIQAPAIDIRYGWTADGGGQDTRISATDDWQFGKLNILAGIQYEKSKPIWGYQRDLTKQYNLNGTSDPTASRDVLVYSATKSANAYYFMDPADCANVAGLFHGTEGKRHRANSGDYCGSFFSPGYRTLKNGSETGNFYTHATFDVNSDMQLYGDFLYNYSEVKYAAGSNYTFWSTGVDFGAYYDPNLDDFVNLQRAFAPEDVGGYGSIMNKNTENSYLLTLGANGVFGDSNWDYDLGYTHSNDKLIQRPWVRFADKIDAYFEKTVLGPNLGPDPYYHFYPTFKPNYAAFYQPIPVDEFRKFTGFVFTHAKTWNNLLRGQLTNASLFSLPGGDAGLAVVLEGGNEGWDYSPDPRLLDGEIWGLTSVQGHGHRSRYALTTEIRLPVWNWLTFDISGRHDDYKVTDHHVKANTYNLGIEVRPFRTLLLRGRYGKAFKAPTLADQFQGLSGYYSFVTDYYNCALLGFSGANIGDCPGKYGSYQFFGQQVGNPDLKPIHAKVWSYGLVWAPLPRLSISADYYHTDVDNVVGAQSANQLTLTEWQCRTGIKDINSPTCKKAISQITRGPNGDIQEIFTPKFNVANLTDNAIVAQARWGHSLGRYGDLRLSLQYSDVLKHTFQQYAGDPVIPLLRNPADSTDFKTKANASATWSLGDWSATLYVDRYGHSPNYLATVYNDYTHPNTHRLGPWFIYNGSVTWHPSKRLSVSLLGNNVFNEMPPFDPTYPGTSGSPYNGFNYNTFGRTMYIEARYQFGQ